MPFLQAAAVSRQPGAAGAPVLWLDANDLAIDGPIDAWPSRSGVTATAPSRNNRPTFSATGLGYRPAVLFDGENDCLSLPTLTTGSSWVALVVCRRDGYQTYGTVFSILSGSNTQAAGLAINNDATKGPVQVSSSAGHNKAGNYSTGVTRILTVSPTVIKQNNVSATVSGISSPFTVSGSLSMIGAANSSTPSRFFCGAIAEVRLYASLTATQEAAVYRELAKKWGVA